MTWIEWGMAGLALPLVWQSAVWLSLGLLIARCLRKQPSLAHLVLLMAFGASIVTPFITYAVDALGWGMLPRRVVTVPSGLNRRAEIEGLLSSSVAARMETFSLVVVSGLMGFYSLFLVRRFVLARRFLDSRESLADPISEDALARAKERISLRRDVGLVEGEESSSFAIWCWSHPPVILYPSAMTSRWDSECLSVMFSHELAHLNRRDHLTSAFADLCSAALIWNPLAWIVRRELSREAERACDAVAASVAKTPADYAESLLDFAQRNQGSRFGLSIHPRGGSLKRRIHSILYEDVSTRTITRRKAAFLLIVFMLSVSLMTSAQRAGGIEYRLESGSFSFVHEGDSLPSPEESLEELPEVNTFPHTIYWVPADR